jgi:phosphomevalonate kinase
VHLALQHTFSLAVEIKSPAAIQKTLTNGLDITIVGDNDFYSQRAKASSYFYLYSVSSSVISLSH